MTRKLNEPEPEPLEPQPVQPQIQRIKYEVNIDFDEASAAWKANKKSLGNGCYKYIRMPKQKLF
jgi:hypothetical protein